MTTQPSALPPYDQTNALLAPAPVNLRTGMVMVNTPDGPQRMFVCTFYGPQSSFTIMLPPDNAEQLVEAMSAGIRQAKSGLVLPQPDMSLFQNGSKPHG